LELAIAERRLPVGHSTTHRRTVNEVSGFRFPVSAVIGATGDPLKPPDAKI
jgi:hypothetical protein